MASSKRSSQQENEKSLLLHLEQRISGGESHKIQGTYNKLRLNLFRKVSDDTHCHRNG